MNMPFNRHTASIFAAADRSHTTAGHSPVLVRELSSSDRERLLKHFLALDEDDRLLRFGQIVLGVDSAAIKDGLRDAGADAPGKVARVEQIG